MLVSLGGLVVNLLGLTAFHEGHAAAHGAAGGCCGGATHAHNDGLACGVRPAHAHTHFGVRMLFRPDVASPDAIF